MKALSFVQNLFRWRKPRPLASRLIALAILDTSGTVGIELGLCLSILIPVALVCAHIIAAPLHNYLSGIDVQLTAAQAALAALQGCAR